MCVLNRFRRQQEVPFWRGILRGAAVLLGAQGGRLFLQGVNLVLAARFLGPANLGALAVLLAVANVLRPLSGFGYQVLVIREAAAHGRHRIHAVLCCGVLAYAVGGLGLGLPTALWLIPPLHLGLSLELVLILLLSEMILGGLHALLSNSWQAEERFAAQARWLVLLPSLRAPLFCGLALLGKLTVESFCVVHAGTLLLLVIVGYLVRTRAWARPKPDMIRSVMSDARAGLSFAVGQASLAILPEIDKLLLPRLAGLAVAGQYVAGIRPVNFATLPLWSLLAAFLPQFFRQGRGGSSPALLLARKAWMLTVPYALLATAALLLAAPLAVPLLGEEYRVVPTIIRWSAGLLVLQAIHRPAGDALIGSGSARFRALSQLLAAATIACLAAVLVPRIGWKGALLAAYVGHAGLAALLVTRLAFLARQDVRISERREQSSAARSQETGPGCWRQSKPEQRKR